METKVIVRKEDFAKVVAGFVREGLHFTATPSSNNDKYVFIIKGF